MEPSQKIIPSHELPMPAKPPSQTYKKKQKMIFLGALLIIFCISIIFLLYHRTQISHSQKTQPTPANESQKQYSITSKTQHISSHAFLPVIYEPTTQNASNGESALQLLKGLTTTFVFRGIFQWGKSSPIAADFSGVTNNIHNLKQAIPGLIYEGGIGAQYFDKKSTWTNGSIISTADFTSMVARNKQGGYLTFPGSSGYVPDLASPLYQKYLEQWSEKQIDAGVDGIFFDDPFYYAQYKVNVLHANASTIYQEYANYLYYNQNSVVKELRSYATAKGRPFFVTINAGRCNSLLTFFTKYPFTLQPNDYISCSFALNDFNANSNPSLQVTEDFNAIKQAAQNIMHKNVPIITFIDWPSEMNMFKKLTTQQQITVLSNIYATTKSQGIYFALPVLVKGQHYDALGNGTYDAMTRLVEQ